MGNINGSGGHGGPPSRVGGRESKDSGKDASADVACISKQRQKWLQLRLEDVFERDWGTTATSSGTMRVLEDSGLSADSSKESSRSDSEKVAAQVGGENGVLAAEQEGKRSSTKQTHTYGRHPRSLHGLCLAKLPSAAVAGCTSSLLSRALSQQCRLSDTFLRNSRSFPPS